MSTTTDDATTDDVRAGGAGADIGRVRESWHAVWPLLPGATAAATMGCLFVAVQTRPPVGFASVFVRYQLIAVAAAWLAVLALGIALCVGGVTEHRIRMLALTEIMLFAVSGGVVGAFGGSAMIGFIVFTVPAGVVFLGALAGRRYFGNHRGGGLAVTAAGGVPAVLGIVAVAMGW